MSISYIAAGALTSHADTVTLAYPAGATAGRLAVLQVVSGHPDDSTPTTPSGWTLAGSFSGGGGSFGAGTGPRRLTWFTRVLVGSDTAPTTQIPSGGSGSLIGGQIIVLSRSAGTGWRWTTTFGEDTSSGTGFSAVCSDTPTWAVGDFAFVGYAVATSSASIGTETLTATGITFSALTHQINQSIATGNTARSGVATGTVTAGSGTQAPTVGATLSAAAVGAAGVLRIREASSDITASPQTAFPPRNLVSVTGLLADDIVSATIYRETGTSRTVVRAADTVDVTSTDALLRVDAEQPLGVANSYAAELTDVGGTVWTVYSGPITSTADSDIVSDAIRGIGAAVRIETPLEWQRTRDATVFNVGGRYVVVGRPRSAPQTTFTVRTESDEAGDALDTVLAGATEGVLLVRKQSTLSRLDGHFALLSDSEAPTWYDEFRWWQLEVTKTEAWPTILEAAGFTLQDVADNYSTLQDLADDNVTLLDLALKDFGV